MLEAKKSFTFETVMSSYDKVELLKLSKSLGYKNYLYYIATSDPSINISRVKNRVAFNGHNVPEDKIVDRYYRSLGYLKEAVKLSNRAYIFDNSSDEKTWICEITNGSKVDMKSDEIPNWIGGSIYCNKDFTSRVKLYLANSSFMNSLNLFIPSLMLSISVAKLNLT